jgi:hypothetical protein
VELRVAVSTSNNQRLRKLSCLLALPPVDRQTSKQSLVHHPADAVRDVLTALVSGYPVQSLLPPAAVPILKKAISTVENWDTKEFLGHLSSLRELVIFQFCSPKTQTLLSSVDVRALLLELCDITLLPFSEASSIVGSDDNKYNNNAVATASVFVGEENYFATGHFYPYLPVLRCIPLYDKDKQLKFRTACNKFIRGAGKSTPGLFLCFCKEHGKMIGYHAMKYSESERTVHNLIYSRFPEAPSIIIYDNGCNLHQYVLFREPRFFRNTTFVLDRLHENSHGSCSPAYSPDQFVQLQRTNTQVVEQKNSLYVQKRAQLYAMGHFMFLFHLRYYTWACTGQFRPKTNTRFATPINNYGTQKKARLGTNR